jgi:lipoprotein-anchoring transpeptidase ErfK/SrfK
VHEKLTINPGPRNPVGLCWVSLSLRGYGIHGTPNPELIGKTGSHGCFRLANWDAVRLGKMVHAGTAVTFVN